MATSSEILYSLMLFGFVLRGHAVLGTFVFNNTNSQPLRTVGCNRDQQRADNPFAAALSTSSSHHSQEHINGTFHEYRGRVKDFLDILQSKKNEWTAEFSSPIRTSTLQEFYPTREHTPSLTNTRASSKHRVLRELRYLLTVLDIYMQLLKSAGPLGLTDGRIFVSHTQRLSSNLDDILRLMRVDLTTMPEAALCRVVPPLRIDSYSHRKMFTALMLRDSYNLFTRIMEVLSSCHVANHGQIRHSHRLICRNHPSLFFVERPIQAEYEFTLQDVMNIH